MTREDKLLLLKWLKDGMVDSSEVQDFLREVPEMTEEEKEAEYIRISRSMYPHFCNIMHRGGLCALCEDKDALCKVVINHCDCRELPGWLAKALGCGTDNCYHNKRRTI